MFSFGSTAEETRERVSIPDDWMIRPCSIYEDEYSDCRSVKARFHQYFIHGKSIDCSQWRRDGDSCYKWTQENDIKAGKELIESEKRRRLERLRPHYQNDVWEKRKEPPADWNKPLPEHISKDYESSYLHYKNMEMKGEIAPVIDDTKCSIM